MREIILDTETTGLNPQAGHRIVEIGCIEMINRIRTGRFFHKYIYPDRDMPEEAFKIHGISLEFLKDKPLFAEIADDFMKFITDATLIIHNASFDLKFLNYELNKLQLQTISDQAVLDTLLMARKKFPGSSVSLDSLCRKFNINLSKRTKHGALLDAELLAEVYIELTGGNQSLLFKEKKSFMPLNNNNEKKVYIESRKFQPSEKELLLHKEFINQIPNTIWQK